MHQINFHPVRHVLRAVLACSLLIGSGFASADWLATDPGTQVSVQVNNNGFISVRPVGGAWSHPVCADVTRAVLVNRQFGDIIVRPTVLPTLYEMLLTAAANGSTVNVFADPTRCHAQGWPLIRAVKIEP